MKKIWLSPPHMSGNELKYIHAAFDNNWIAPVGENVDEFENSLRRYLDIPYVTALNSGTAALHLALINLGIKAGDEVIVSAFTFVASVNPIIYQSAVPIFVDSEPETWNMDPELLEAAIKDRLKKGKKPGAIILVHLYGMPAKMREILAISSRYDIPIIEDAAESLGSKYEGQHLGTFGEMGVLSFNGNKIITTSGGGALISNYEKHAKDALFLATQAKDEFAHYEHSSVGYNYRMTTMQAAIGLKMMDRIDDYIKQRRENAAYLTEKLNKIDGFIPMHEPSDCKNTYYLYCLF